MEKFNFADECGGSPRLDEILPTKTTSTWITIAKLLAMGTGLAGASYLVARYVSKPQQPTSLPEPPEKLQILQIGSGRSLSRPLIGPNLKEDKEGESGDGPAKNLNGLEQARIDQLCLYPIKSCRGILVETFFCGEMGPEIRTAEGLVVRDRSYMIATQKYTFITQRMAPRMSLIDPSINGQQMEINAPDMPALFVPLSPDPDNYKKIDTKVWADEISAIDLGDEAGAWFATFLQIPGVRCLYHPEEFSRRELSTSKAGKSDIEVWEKSDTCSFADAAPYLLLSRESVDEFSTKLISPITWSHFRPNILVSGCSAYAEDTWTNFGIGSAKFRNAKACTRCVMTTVDPQSGAFDRKDVLKTLTTYRVNQSPEWQSLLAQKPIMAINLGILVTGIVSIGDAVRMS